MSGIINASEFPRTLVLSSCAFNQYTGGGVMLTNFFKGWPKGRLADIHADIFSPETSVCEQFFRLSPSEMRWSKPFSFLQGSLPTQPLAFGSSSNGASKNIADSIRPTLKDFFKKVLGPEMFWSTTISPELTAWIDSFRPEVLYMLVGGPYMKFAMQIADRWKIPIVAHMMDDWPAYKVGHGILSGFVNQQRQKEIREIFSVAACNLAISEEMCVEYQQRYGHAFAAFQNGTDVAERMPHARKEWSAGSPFRVLYVGSIMPNAQLQGLIDVAVAVDALAGAGEKICFDIHSPWSNTYSKELRKFKAVNLLPALEEVDIFKKLTSADVLVLPVNFDQESVSFIRYSMPAKIPLYLISGTPILAYGPADVASIGYALRDGWARVVSQRSQEQLVAALKDLMNNIGARQALGQRGQALAAKNHDAARTRELFRHQLAAVAGRAS